MRRRILVATLVGIVAAVTLALGATASGTTSPQNRLFAYVAQPLPGPLHTGETVWDYIYVVNANRPTNDPGSRLTRPNSFVVDNIDIHPIVDGTEFGSYTVNPPPDVPFPRR